MPDPSPDFQLRAAPNIVEVTVLANGSVRVIDVSPQLARRLAGNLVLFAERAERLAEDEQAPVPREGAVRGERSSETVGGAQKP